MGQEVKGVRDVLYYMAHHDDVEGSVRMPAHDVSPQNVGDPVLLTSVSYHLGRSVDTDNLKPATAGFPQEFPCPATDI
jgi:hypothetical protein